MPSLDDIAKHNETHLDGSECGPATCAGALRLPHPRLTWDVATDTDGRTYFYGHAAGLDGIQPRVTPVVDGDTKWLAPSAFDGWRGTRLCGERRETLREAQIAAEQLAIDAYRERIAKAEYALYKLGIGTREEAVTCHPAGSQDDGPGLLA